MAPILYCTCSNCSCTATVLLTHKIVKEAEHNKMEEMQVDTNKTIICEEFGRRKEDAAQQQKEETIETFVILAGGALLLLGG